MKKGLSILTLLFSFALGNTSAWAQAGLKPADQKYDRWAYMDAVRLYEKVYEKGYASQEMTQKLANAYYFNARYAEAQKYYQSLFTEFEADNLSSDYFYRYAQTLQNVGNDAEAKKYYDLFLQKAESEQQIVSVYKNKKELEQQIIDNSGRVDQVINLPVNTPYADYGAFVHNKLFYYTSAKDTGGLAKRTHTWTGNAFTSLYTADAENILSQKESRQIKGEVKSRLNESSAVVTKDGSTMYFTRNNILKGTRKFDDKKSTKLKIYKAVWKNNQWSEVVELPFNSNQFNTAHPALSDDEKTLYFSSDRPGGYGQADLWKVAISGDHYGTPENLGAEINTEARETFPFVVHDELYFSSNGRVGLGGLDVYVTQLKKEGGFSAVQNLGEPINSVSDDFAYYINKDTQQGFFSSDRSGGKGNDDIYSFTELRTLVLDCDQKLLIKVIDAKTGKRITDAKVSLFDATYQPKGISNQYADPTYPFENEYKCGDVYRIKAEKEGYLTQEVSVTLPNETGVTEKTIVLEPAKLKFKEGDDLFKVLELNPIYFDLDKDFIRKDAALELAKVQAVLEEYPTMEIDIRSHTDSRASHKYNENLSSRRAKSTAEWLISKGISRKRLTWRGYGETQLVNDCADGVNCSEEEHQMNRRSEFIIIKM